MEPKRVLEYSPPRERASWRIDWRLTTITLAILCVVFFAAAATIREARTASVPARPVAPAPATSPKLTFDQIVKGIGGSFALQTTPMMDGSTKYFGTHPRLDAAMLMQGSREEIKYAHVGLKPSAYLQLAANPNAPAWQIKEADQEQLGQAIEQVSLLQHFAENIAPAWKARVWINSSIPKALSEKPAYTFQNGVYLTMKLDKELLFLIAEP